MYLGTSYKFGLFFVFIWNLERTHKAVFLLALLLRIQVYEYLTNIFCHGFEEFAIKATCTKPERHVHPNA